jgi:hypothetical protein
MRGFRGSPKSQAQRMPTRSHAASLSFHGFQSFEVRENIQRTCRIRTAAATFMVNQS